MEEKEKDLWDKVGENLYLNLFTLIGAITAIGVPIGIVLLMIKNPTFAFWVVIILLVIVFSSRKTIATFLFERNEANKEKEMSQRALESARKLRFENAPKYLSEEQQDQLNRFWYEVNVAISKIPIFTNNSTPFTKEELYTLLFINKESVETVGKTVTGEVVKITAHWKNNKAEVLNESELKKHAPVHYTSVSTTQKPVSKQVKKQRKLRKLHAEAKAKGMIIKNGKLYQTPNYTFLANEWVLNNIGLINKIIVDNDTPSSLVIKGTIFADKLPADKALWRYIGKNLIETDNIDNFSIQKNGIQVVINK